MLFYISLPGWSNIKLCTMVDLERFSVFKVDHWVQQSGHPCLRVWQSFHIKLGWAVNHFPVQRVPGILSPGLNRGRGVTLTTHPHLVPRSKISRSYTASPPSDFVACSGTALVNHTSNSVAPEPADLSPYLQEPATGPWPEPTGSTLPPANLYKNHFDPIHPSTP
jgi:hypothetical protein